MRDRFSAYQIRTIKHRSTEERGQHRIELIKEWDTKVERETLTYENGVLQLYEYAEVQRQ